MAPILLKEYTWTENETSVFVTVPFKWKPSPNKDLFTYKNYIKVNAPPFIFELFLFHDIEEKGSKCSFTDERMVFELLKQEPGLWLKLEENLNNKEKVSRRIEINEGKLQQEEEVKASRKERMRELQNLAVQEQIDLDSRNRKAIENVKNNEKEKANAALETWKTLHSIPLSYPEKEEATLFSLNQSEVLPITKEETNKSKTYDFPIPLVRQGGNIQVHFTERVFPTPTRESLQNEEKEYLQKQLEARRATGFVSEDLRPEECDPVWLKNKGDSFQKCGNYLGAISAYSHAIKLGSKMPSLYSNRAAAHQALGNLHKALEDCSTELDLLTPKVPANSEARAKAHARRAAILCQLGLPEKSLPEFHEALKLSPDDEKLREDYTNARCLAEEKEESD